MPFVNIESGLTIDFNSPKCQGHFGFLANTYALRLSYSTPGYGSLSMISILSNPICPSATRNEICSEEHEVYIDFLAEKLVHMDRLLANVVGEKEYSTRL